MSRADALLETIFTRPDDDGPRLVYADWLEENGACARAEFIRVQIEADRTENESRRQELQRRADELLAANQSRWNGEVPSISNIRLDYVRGFAQIITTGIRDYIVHADEIARTAPLQDIQLILSDHDFEEGAQSTDDDPEILYDIPDEDARLMHELANCRHLQRWRSLDASRRKLQDSGYSALMRSPFLTNLARLEIPESHLSESFWLLAGWTHISSLRYINAWGAIPRYLPDRVSESGLRSLMNARHLAELEHLDLGADDLVDWSLRVIADSRNMHMLHELLLGHNQFTSDGVSALVSSQNLPRLKRLDVNYCWLRDEALELIIHWERLADLDRLRLGNNRFSFHGVSQLMSALESSEIRDLGISWDHATVDEFSRFIGAPVLERIAHLDLSGLYLERPHLDILLSSKNLTKLKSVSIQSLDSELTRILSDRFTLQTVGR